ncbi:unnamed protein product (macronuclear) [Paramecium tetraurelia]|uniref:Uncharacterized protein n=1 Tax=Paramecium tetraurelia TaxID=5888 RepID=A0EDV9_PARTE|nr:uncharacterized protein GSPATT00025820001 [Paramecium tetraurelia]CAK93476.1 unnamed protein product [Paramecium tetraurelia]|eukprot:XP_001460873.1 hypothetical protein (macronuclear) [Paramecium tetraurelia strain d4-2]
MNKILSKSFRQVHSYWISKSYTTAQEIQLCSSRLDLARDDLESEELTTLICTQLDPTKLIDIYNRYKHQFTDRHLLQSLKITAKMQGMYSLPIHNDYFNESYQNLIRQFNQYISTLNNLDLGDFIYWYKKLYYDKLSAEYLNSVDRKQLQQITKKYIEENQFLPRQLNMIYECVEMIFPNDEFLNKFYIDYVFSTNDITIIQLMQFLTSINKKFILKKRVDLYSILQALNYSKNMRKSFDVDQYAFMTKTFINMRLKYHITEKQYLEQLDDKFEYTKQNVKYLESGSIIAILQNCKYSNPEEYKSLLLLIHEQVQQMLQKYEDQQCILNFDFLIQYLQNLIQADYIDNKDVLKLESACLNLLKENYNISNVNQMSIYYLEKKTKSQPFVEYLKIILKNLTIQNINLNIKNLLYLHFICEVDISPYLENLNNQNFFEENQYDIQISKTSIVNLIILFEEYPSIQLPQYIGNQYYKMGSMPLLLALCNCSYFSPKIRQLYTLKIKSLRNEDRFDKRFRQNLLESIKTEEDASHLFKWFFKTNKFQLNTSLLQVLNANENYNLSRAQAYFLYLVIQSSIDVLNIEIIINQLTYQNKLFDQLLQIDSEIINQILAQSYKFNEGQGTAIMIQLLEQKFPDNLKQFNIPQHLMLNYQELQEYDTNFILMMIKYNCYPLKDSLKIFNNLINFSQNELRLFVLYLEMSQTIGLEKMHSYILKQIKKLNETYIIQIQ